VVWRGWWFNELEYGLVRQVAGSKAKGDSMAKGYCKVSSIKEASFCPANDR
jgi:hypothetical protein